MTQVALRFLLAGGLLSGLLGALPSAAQGTVRRHLVYFQNKTGTPYSVAQPQAFLSARALARRSRQAIAVLPRDLPVNPAYVAQVRAVAGSPRVLYTSRWFNAVAVECDSAVLGRIVALPSVRNGQTLNRGPRKVKPYVLPALVPTPLNPAAALATRADYGPAYAQNQQIGVLDMHDAGFRGQGMQIAVFDAGFPGVDVIPAFQPLFQQQRLASTRNFVDGGTDVYQRNSHGTNCLSIMGASQPGYYIGAAPEASYHLCLTEDVGSEHPIEEANWLAAAEYADSVGVDIISSSLGYSTFDAPSVSHTYADMDGRTTIASRAAAIAARVGIVVVVSAGNEGNSSWRYITAPADADSIVSVGAVDSLGTHASFSSYGPTADGRIKPTLSTMGFQTAVLAPSGGVFRGSGTSFAGPMLAGLAAGFWQANPTLTAQQVIAMLKQSASQANNPDNTLGYGIPSFTAANALSTTKYPLGSAVLAIYPNPTGDGRLTLALPANLRNVPLQVRIIDARGAVVARQTLLATAAEAPLNLPSLAKGTYLCEVRANGTTRTVRFMQQ